MKRWIHILSLTLLAQWGLGQTLTGVVKDFGTKNPLPGANVVGSNGEGTTTAADGSFSIEISEYPVVVSVSFIGYETFISDTLEEHKPGVWLLVQLEELNSNLGEVVVSAGRFEQRLEEVTVSLDVLTPKLQEDKNLVGLEVILQQAPGVNVTDRQANIRGGSGWSYGTGTRVQTLVDNLPLISGDAAQSQWDMVPLHSVEQIEVVKGASSVLYGSAAMNGIINVITHSFPEKQGLMVNLYSGFYDNPRRSSVKWWDDTRFNSGFNFDLRKPISAQSALIISGGHIADQGFRYLEDEQRSRVFAKYLFRSQKIKGLEASVATNVSYNDKGDLLMWESDSLAYIPSDSAITNTYGWDFYIDPKVSYRHGRILHTLQGRYLELNNNARSTEADYTNFSEQYQGQYLLQFFYNDKLTITTGVALAYTNSTSVVFVGNHTASNNAVFLQTDLKPLPWLNLNAGLRYENYHLDERFSERPVFRGGASVRITEGTHARLSYGEAFRFPAISEAYTSTSFGAINVYPNPELDPETGNSVELGLRQMFRVKKVKGYVDLAYFQMRYYNMIEFTFGGWGPAVPPGFGLGFKPLNVGETLIRGFEIASSLTGNLGKKVEYRLLGGYTYVLPQVVNPNQPFAQDINDNNLTYTISSSDPDNRILKYRYQHLVKLDGQVDIGRWNAGLSVRYNDFMQNIDALFNDAVEGVKENRQRNSNGDFVIDLRAGYDLSQRLRMDVLANNLFNEEVMIRPGLLEAPRQFVLRINFTL